MIIKSKRSLFLTFVLIAGLLLAGCTPRPGAGTAARRWKEIEPLLQEMGFSYTVKFTEARGHAMRLVEDGILKGYRFILGLGGDGTNHEIANGILSQTIVPSTEITYTLLPIGTGNDWARMYRIPFDPRKRLEKLRQPQTVLQDVGLVRYQGAGAEQQRYFVNVAGMAYDAFLVQQMESRPRKPKPFLYLLLIVQYLFKYRLRPARILFEDKVVEDLLYTVNVGICKYSGGGMQLVPQAVPDDGLLALTFARNVPKLEVLLQTYRFYAGTILNHPLIEGFNTQGPVRVETMGSQATLVEADGEFLGTTPAVFEIREKALKVAL